MVPNSIEAINNKAWILHTYLDRTREALDIVVDLQKRANPGSLPGEFYDTLGAIQESDRPDSERRAARTLKA